MKDKQIKIKLKGITQKQWSVLLELNLMKNKLETIWCVS